MLTDTVITKGSSGMVITLATKNKFERALIYGGHIRNLETVPIHKTKIHVERILNQNQCLMNQLKLIAEAREVLAENDVSRMMYSSEHIEELIRQNPDITLTELSKELAEMSSFPQDMVLQSLIIIFDRLEGRYMYLEDNVYTLNSKINIFIPSDYDITDGYTGSYHAAVSVKPSRKRGRPRKN